MKRAIAKLRNTVISKDCLAVMADMPSDSIDMCFADPPFNLNKKYASYRDGRATQDYLQWCEEWLSELVRITKPTGSIFVHNIPKWLTHYSGILNQRAIFRHWISWQAVGRPLGKTLLPSHYGILFYVKDEKAFKFYDLRAPHTTCRVCSAYLKDYGGKEDQRHPWGAMVGDVWTDIHRIRHNKRRDPHPCQLPPHLLERLILMSTDVGDVVFDPFMGTGTTAIAAKQLGRFYIGSELDKKYAAIAAKKAEAAVPTKIGKVYASEYLGKIVTIRDVDVETLTQQKQVAKKPATAVNGTRPKKRAVVAPPPMPVLLEKKKRYRRAAG